MGQNKALEKNSRSKHPEKCLLQKSSSVVNLHHILQLKLFLYHLLSLFINNCNKKGPMNCYFAKHI